MIVAIIACEIAFWVFVAAGLLVRYGLRMPRLGAALLVLVPVIDLVLLALIVVDLRGGATAEWSHGLGAVYLGISIVYGHAMVKWADARASAWFTKTARVRRPKLYGVDRIRKEWIDFGKWLIAAGISAALLGLCIVIVGDPARTEALTQWFSILGLITVVSAIWAISYTLWPGRAPVER